MVPSVLLALKLAGVLGVSVETLFRITSSAEFPPSDER
jgi:hypothetical protein